MGKKFAEYSKLDLSEVNRKSVEEMGRKPGFRQEYDRT